MNNKTVLSVTNEKKAPGESPGRNIKLQTKHSTIHIPVPGKNGELDVKVETNVIPTRRADYYANLFITKLAPVMCMFCILLLAFMLNYQASQLHAAMLKVDCLSERVDELNVKSADLKGRLAILQEKYDVIVSEQPKAKRPNSLINDGREEMNDDNDTTLEIDSVPIITLDKLLDFSANLENQTNVRKNPLNATTENTDAPKLSIATTNGVPEAVENELLINKDLPNSAGDGSLIRAKRSNRRGNQKRTAGGRRSGNLNKKSKNHGATVLHLKGAVPEQFIEDQGLIAPWFIDEKAAGEFPLNRYEMRDGKGSVEITEPGLYYIYAQVFYLTPELTNSYSITLQEQDHKSQLENIALCSTNGSTNKQTTEVSCFTSVVRFLNATDRIFLRQRERKRRIILREGHSFLGIVLLNSKKGSR